MAVQCEVPIGFERSDLDSPEVRLSIDESQSTIKDVLNHIVKEVSFYKWELRDGVIKFVPVRGRIRVLEDFLSIHVREFKATSDLNKFDLRNYVYDLPEVELFLKANSLKTDRLRDPSVPAQQREGM